MGSAHIFLCNVNKALNVKLIMRRVYHLCMLAHYDSLFLEQVIRKSSWAQRNKTETEIKPLRFVWGAGLLQLLKDQQVLCVPSRKY